MAGPGDVSIFVRGRQTRTWEEPLGAVQGNIGAETAPLEGNPYPCGVSAGTVTGGDWQGAAYGRAKLKRLTLADTND